MDPYSRGGCPDSVRVTVAAFDVAEWQVDWLALPLLCAEELGIPAAFGRVVNSTRNGDLDFAPGVT